ncbi:hypothetical protein ALP25_200054 [Pseudomonas syringae pv. syringae]|nr:hypothetical protein ALP25_200054 [Pseudomonas syringae pv. syringae]
MGFSSWEGFTSLLHRIYIICTSFYIVCTSNLSRHPLHCVALVCTVLH